MASAASLAPAQARRKKTMLLRKLVAKKQCSCASSSQKLISLRSVQGLKAHAPAASLSVQKTFAIPSGVAAFHSNQLLSAFQSKNVMPLIEQVFITEVFIENR
ncbi:hypothetical protein AM499_00610 [Bacillus sp. FJAT-22090]|nr:hypothetical protein AM499_00610 [Bacillus sp. FJAT-22090]